MEKYIIYTILLSLVCSGNGQKELKEIEVIESILAKNINIHSRPVNSENEAVSVMAYLQVQHIQELNEFQGVLTVNGWMNMHWVDSRLAWDVISTDVHVVKLSSESIWIPDIHLWNNANASNNKILGKDHAFVRSDGSVHWFPIVTLSSICDMDFSWFPMDVQICPIKLASWIHSDNKLNLTFGYYDQLENVTTYFFDDHNQWELIKQEAEVTFWWIYEDWRWPTLEFRLHMRRHAPYYHLTFVIPCVVALLLTVITFWLPSTASERLYLGAITNTLITVMLIQFYWVVPRSASSLPGIVVLCGNMAIFSIISLIISITSLTLSNTSRSTPVPKFAQDLIQSWLGTILCLKLGTSKVSVDARLSSADNIHLQVNEGKKSTREHQRSKWIVVATMIDRAFFMAYCLSYFILLLVAFT